MEIVVRALVVFFFLWVITRVVGRTTLGELSTFELLLYVTMGDMVQQAVTQQDYSVTSAFLAVGVFALLTVALSYTSWRFPGLRPLIRGRPVVIVRNGDLVTAEMARQRMPFDDLVASAREQGIRRISDIEIAVLETNGKISFFTEDANQGRSGAPEDAPMG
jgi:uncharacterized membrane protein YcaP (DUF421 family)